MFKWIKQWWRRKNYQWAVQLIEKYHIRHTFFDDFCSVELPIITVTAEGTLAEKARKYLRRVYKR